MPTLTLVAAIALVVATNYSPSIWVDLSLGLAAVACLVYSIWRSKRAYFLQLAVLAAVPVVPVANWLEGQVVAQDRHWQQMAIEDDLVDLAGRIRDELISNTGYLNALVLLIGNTEESRLDNYHDWLDQLIDPGEFAFLNIALTRDLVITHVYPETGTNRALLGTDMRDVPEQLDDLRAVMDRQQGRILGPMTVMQGDTALVYRLPVPDRPNMVVSGVLSLDEILSTASLSGTERYDMSLSVEHAGERTFLITTDGLGPHAATSAFVQDGVRWELAAEPRAGWSVPAGRQWLIRGGALAAWVFLMAILGAQYRAVQRRDRERKLLETQEKELLEAQRLGRLGSWNTVDGRRYTISAPLAELLGTDKDELTFEEVLGFIYEPDHEYYLSHTRQVLKGQAPFTKFEHRILTPDSLLWVEHSVALNSQRELTGMLRDITEIKTTEAELQKLAYYDSLTGASNRNFFSKQVQQGIALSRRNGNHLALILFDLDDFKVINARYGHTIGDEVLKLLTERIKQCVRRSDTVARLSGDTFAVCLQNLKDPSHSIFVADTILKTIAEVLEVDELRINMTGTLGIATCPEDDIHYEGLVKKAEMALQKAKEVDRGYYQFYSDQLNQENDRRQDILRLLPDALNNNEFYLVLQPRVSARDRSWCSIEVLIRWESDTLGFVSPGEFIPIAEGSHLIVDIGNWVIREALTQFARHIDELPPEAVLSINLSPKQLEHRDLPHFVGGEIQLAGIPAHRVEFEITEHSLTEESDTTLNTLSELSAMGIRFAMDDFGTGYSNLGMLQSLPLNVLKIDQRFVQQLDSGDKHRELVRAIINMGHTLGLTVVAEGVETPAQVSRLTELGCDELQGFHFYRPQRMEALLEGLERTTTP